MPEWEGWHISVRWYFMAMVTPKIPTRNGCRKRAALYWRSAGCAGKMSQPFDLSRCDSRMLLQRGVTRSSV